MQAQILGNAQAVGSLKYLEDQIAKLGELPSDLRRFKSRRNKKALEVFREKRKLRNCYAVVCDAEQVICAEINKDRDNEVVYTSGSIENPVINKKIVDVLEGTRPAFDKRDAKYLP